MNQLKYLSRCALYVVLMQAAVSSQAAGIINGDFGTGDFTGWDVGVYYGSANVVGPNKVASLYASGPLPDPIYPYPVPGVVNLNQSFMANRGDIFRVDIYNDHGIDEFAWGMSRAGLRGDDGTFQTFVTSSTPQNQWVTFQSSPLESRTYDIEIQLAILGGAFGAFSLDNARIVPIGTFENPSLPIQEFVPDPTEPPVFVFEQGASGWWFDPPIVSGYSFEMTSGSLFTGILDFPTGFDDLFVVKAGGITLGSYGPGQSVDFTSFAGGGVSAFTIENISPNVDAADSSAFPVKLAFNTPYADFTMQGFTPVPEASTAILAIVGVSTIVLLYRKRTP